MCPPCACVSVGVFVFVFIDISFLFHAEIDCMHALSMFFLDMSIYFDFYHMNNDVEPPKKYRYIPKVTHLIIIIPGQPHNRQMQ